MDHVGFKNNPRKRDLDFQKFGIGIKNITKKIKQKPLMFIFHHHPIHFQNLQIIVLHISLIMILQFIKS